MTNFDSDSDSDSRNLCTSRNLCLLCKISCDPLSMFQVPSPGPLTPTSLAAHHKKKLVGPGLHKESGLPKPAYSYSCLIALALKNSTTGHMSVSEIYKFMW